MSELELWKMSQMARYW